MDFVTVMDQAIALLRQRGRLTYRTLQLQFQLDDAHLAALKDELIEGQRLAVDEAGRVLIWTGAPGATALADAASASLPAPRTYTPPYLDRIGFFIFRLREVPLTPGRERWMSISQ